LAQQPLCAATSFSTASHRLCHRCQRSPPCTASGRAPVDGLGVGAGAVPADHLNAGMRAQPRLDGVGPAVGQDIEAFAGRRVDEHGGIPVPAQGEVLHPEHPRHRPRRNRQRHQQPQHRGGRDHHRPQRQQPSPGPAGARPPPPARSPRPAAGCGAESAAPHRESAPGRSGSASPGWDRPAGAPAPRPPPGSCRSTDPPNVADGSRGHRSSASRSPDTPPAPAQCGSSPRATSCSLSVQRWLR
jgi:hypothetical protein